MSRRATSLVAGILALACACTTRSLGQSPDDWPYYGHDAGGMRYSPLAQINRENVANLKLAWTFHVGDISEGGGGKKRTGLETTPILVEGTLYLTTGFNRVFALDPESGTQRWVYDPMIDTAASYGDGLINRGVAAWIDNARTEAKSCRLRIFEATLDARLVALDGVTGEPCLDFGNHGQISLREVARYIPAQYHMTSPPAVIDDVVVVGSAIDDNSRVEMSSGVVRGFDTRTGALRWKWEPLPPNEPECKDATLKNAAKKPWRTGAGNAWSVMVVDPERDLVFVPTGSASPDYYGGLRPGDDKWANSVVALRGKTGEFVWGFQLVHHDLWDFDSASPPLLATLQRDGKAVPVVIQGNKTGFLFVLNRDTGVPVFPVEERPVPQTDVPGEVASPTQPFPVVPPAVSPQKFSVDDAWGITPEDRDYCRERLKSLRYEGLFTPPSLRGSLSLPGNVGGMNWSGYAYDPLHSVLVVNSNNLPAKMRLVPAEKYWDEVDKNTEDGQFTEQAGGPYGIFRTFLFAKEHERHSRSFTGRRSRRASVPLTRDRAKPAVTFGGIYRIIDITLSNCINSDLRRVYILTQYKALSLNRHIREGWNIVGREVGEFIEVLPPMKRVSEQWYQGTADAVYQNIYSIGSEQPKYVLILSGDHIYKMDYGRC
jgi:quinoprotein glucose dehydrogenase